MLCLMRTMLISWEIYNLIRFFFFSFIFIKLDFFFNELLFHRLEEKRLCKKNDGSC